MSEQKVLVVFGTRPEAIKLAPVIRRLQAESVRFCARVCVTAQHRSMLDQVLKVFDITPDHDLGIMKEAQDLFEVTTRCLERLQPVLEQEKPDWVLVQGDTTTTFAASFAAYYRKIRVGHVEAGLRTDDKFKPFPEEMNRRLTSCLADAHFAPTPRAKQNLLREGISEDTIYVTGNTGIDALFYAREIGRKNLLRVPGLESWAGSRRMILVTGHRRESFGPPLERICQAIRRIALEANVDVIYSVHLNPRVRETVLSVLHGLSHVYLVEPVDYIQFVGLMDRAHFIVTDSGGIQEEAPYLGKPVLVTRDRTERPEGVEEGTARLVGTDPDKITAETVRLLEDPTEYERMSRLHDAYGDGEASARIAEILASQAGE